MRDSEKPLVDVMVMTADEGSESFKATASYGDGAQFF